MCRDNDHGGRRCPHDNSDARQARRIRARARGELGNVLGVATEPIEIPVEPEAPEVTVAQVVAVRNEVARLREVRSQASGSSGPWVVDGQEYTALTDYVMALDAAMEQRTIIAGGMVASIAAKRSGVSDDAVADYHAAEVAKVQGIVDAKPETPLTDEQQARLVEVERELTENTAQREAFEAEHVNDYPHETLSGFPSRLMVYLRDNQKDATALALFKQLDAFDGRRMTLLAERSKINSSKTDAYYTAHNRYRELMNPRGAMEPVVAEMLRKRAEAYESVLGEMRELGGNLEVAADSRKNKVKVLESGLRYFPRDWIDASNKATNVRPLRVKYTGGRAHYSDAKAQKKSTRVPSYRIYVHDADWQPDPNNVRDHGMIKLERNEHSDAVLEVNGYQYTASVYGGETAWARPDLEVYNDTWDRNRQTAPAGRGWQKVITHYESMGETHEATNWVRQRTRVRESSRTITAELTVDDDKSGFTAEPGFTTAIHEFSHRVEATSGGHVSRMQEVFLQRRRQVDESGQKEKLSSIYAGRSEYAYRDSFTSHYMGKVYAGGKHFELLSTGMEALFGGNYGGLMGAQSHKRDLDHQHLILGLLATG